ncbi:hypothetical protein E2C01_072129 [Portunus trituberculatus]|uniref:Uncharacterized protein n=1 Tax=Portunus trituberculatus TaxID=210409 RepID=A0A5B7HZ40_PORTR|nr:hypothetical protein [Portunus trituberculatus]
MTLPRTSSDLTTRSVIQGGRTQSLCPFPDNAQRHPGREDTMPRCPFPENTASSREGGQSRTDLTTRSVIQNTYEMPNLTYSGA